MWKTLCVSQVECSSCVSYEKTFYIFPFHSWLVKKKLSMSFSGFWRESVSKQTKKQRQRSLLNLHFYFLFSFIHSKSFTKFLFMRKNFLSSIVFLFFLFVFPRLNEMLKNFTTWKSWGVERPLVYIWQSWFMEWNEWLLPHHQKKKSQVPFFNNDLSLRKFFLPLFFFPLREKFIKYIRKKFSRFGVMKFQFQFFFTRSIPVNFS